MKQLYLDCSMGAAGDMLSAALFELIDDKERIISEMNGIGLPGIVFTPEVSKKCGITGTHFKVEYCGAEEEPAPDINAHSHSHDGETHHHHHAHDEHHHHGHDEQHAAEHQHHHHHIHLQDINSLIDGLNVPQQVKENAKAVYKLIAQAEAKVHGGEMEHIHFHEVGTMDAVADAVAVCFLMNELSPEKIVVSPVRLGYGTVKCAHGILPVPAPATAELVQGMPVYAGDLRAEMCTPTGAALLKHFASEFGNMPLMKVNGTGYGMGKKDFDQYPNCIRAIFGESWG